MRKDPYDHEKPRENRDEQDGPQETTMPTMHLEPITEVTADDRGRVGLGKAGARKDERYAVSKAGDGTIVLTPVTSIPTRELVIWENDEFRSSLLRGIGEFAAGKVEPLDWSIFGDDTDDEG